jgi:hypothetical protein
MPPVAQLAMGADLLIAYTTELAPDVDDEPEAAVELPAPLRQPLKAKAVKTEIRKATLRNEKDSSIARTFIFLCSNR